MLSNNKMLYNSSDSYISRTLRPIKKRATGLESMGLVTPYMKFLTDSKCIFCKISTLRKI